MRRAGKTIVFGNRRIAVTDTRPPEEDMVLCPVCAGAGQVKDAHTLLMRPCKACKNGWVTKSKKP